MARLWVGTSESNLTQVKTPSSLDWTKITVSDDDAGRVRKAEINGEERRAIMFVKKIADKRSLDFTWQNLNANDVSTILIAFDHEYIYCKYKDPKTNTYETRQFYTGDMKASVYSYALDGIIYKTLSFGIIER